MSEIPDFAEVPAALIRLMLEPKPRTPRPKKAATNGTNGGLGSADIDVDAAPPVTERAKRWVAGAFRSAIADLESAPIGDRNNTLNRVALRLAHFIGGGRLDEDETRKALVAAGRKIGLGDVETFRTIRSAFDKGIPEPIYGPPAGERIEDPPEPQAKANGPDAGEGEPPGGAAKAPLPESAAVGDFRAYLPMHQYVYAPTRDLWPAVSVDARLLPIPLLDKNGDPKRDANGKVEKMKASAWLDRHQHVAQMTWAPGQSEIIKDRLIANGGWIDHLGDSCFNLYRPPAAMAGDPEKAGPWLELGRDLYPDNHRHIVSWFAHRVQRPEEKINHALVLAGKPGIGKDTYLEPLKVAVGPWNYSEVSPAQMLGRFNNFLRSVVIRMNESHDLGEFDRFALFERMKTYLASPPDTLRVDEKHLREYSIVNCCSVVVTTNHEQGGLYLPPDDRRHFVDWSPADTGHQPSEYWLRMWSWYHTGGIGHVAAYLGTLDISGFNPKAPPPKTPAFWRMADFHRSSEEGDLADILDELSNPSVVTLAAIIKEAKSPFYDWLIDIKNRRVVPHRLAKCGYIAVRNDTAQDGFWVLKGKRTIIYARRELSLRDQLAAAREHLAKS